MAEIESDREALATKEVAIARATENLSQDAAVRAAWKQGGQAKIRWCLFLIDCQMATLHSAGMHYGMLAALRRQVEEGEHA